MDAVVFQVAQQRYAMPAAQVQEAVRAVAIVPLPKAPPIVEGVINVRGRLVPVLDLRARFRLPAKPLEPADYLLLAWAERRLVAIRAEPGVRLQRIEEGEVETLAQVVAGSDYIAGVGKLADGLVLIHDLATFLTQAEAAALDQSLRPDQGEAVGP